MFEIANVLEDLNEKLSMHEQFQNYILIDFYKESHFLENSYIL